MKKALSILMSAVIACSAAGIGTAADCHKRNGCDREYHSRVKSCICIDGDNDGICDNCGKSHTKNNGKHCFTDGNKDSICDNCGKTYENCVCGKNGNSDSSHGKHSHKHKNHGK